MPVSKSLVVALKLTMMKKLTMISLKVSNLALHSENKFDCNSVYTGLDFQKIATGVPTQLTKCQECSAILSCSE
jgi:hypothetical protein